METERLLMEVGEGGNVTIKFCFEGAIRGREGLMVRLRGRGFGTGGGSMLRVDDGVGLEGRGSHQECWCGGLVRGMARGMLEKRL